MKSELITALTPKQERFCQEYIIDLNATASAKRAGYSARTAMEQGYQLLQNTSVHNYIQELKQQRREENQVTAQKVIEELAKIAFVNIKDVFMLDNKLMDVTQMDSDVAASILSVKFYEDRTQDGEVIGYNKEIKFHDKLRALEMLGRHLGIFEKDNLQAKDNAINVIYLGEGINPKKEI